MNEYLNPDNYEYIESNSLLIPDNWIEIPVGAEVALKFDIGISFYKDNGKKCFSGLYPVKNVWEDCLIPFNDICAYAEIIWQRNPKNKNEDAVNNPSHYKKGGIECIDAIESSMTKEAFCGYLKGNVQKYMWQYENKGSVESLKKAQWYLNKLIEVEGK